MTKSNEKINDILLKLKLSFLYSSLSNTTL